jgi:hypothetical protein
MAVLTGSLQGHLATDPLSKCSWWSIARSTQNIIGPMMQRWYTTVTLFRLRHGVRFVFMLLNLKGFYKCCQSVYPTTNIHNTTQLTQVWNKYTFRHRGDIFKELQDLWPVSYYLCLLVDIMPVRIDTTWIISNSQMFRHRIQPTQCLNVEGN